MLVPHTTYRRRREIATDLLHQLPGHRLPVPAYAISVPHTRPCTRCLSTAHPQLRPLPRPVQPVSVPHATYPNTGPHASQDRTSHTQYRTWHRAGVGRYLSLAYLPLHAASPT
eukprot:2415944-Rhodomonas_salina.1